MTDTHDPHSLSPSSAGAAPQDVAVPPLPPDQLAARRALRQRATHAVMLASTMFFGGLATLPPYVVPRVPLLCLFGVSAFATVALCGRVVRALRAGLAPRLSFALGLVLGGVSVAAVALLFAFALAQLGDALGSSALGVAEPFAGLLVVSCAVGLLGLTAHRPLVAGAVVSFSLLAGGAASFVVAESPRAQERVSIDGAHELVRYPARFRELLTSRLICGSFTLEHTGLRSLVRRPVLSCETGRGVSHCDVEIGDVTTTPRAFRLHLTDGDTAVVAADGSTVTCESDDAVCRIDCRRAGRSELEVVRIERTASLTDGS